MNYPLVGPNWPTLRPSIASIARKLDQFVFARGGALGCRVGIVRVL